MSIGPNTLQITPDGRTAEQIADLARRVGVLERGGGGSGGTGTVVDATTAVKGKLQLAGDLSGTASAPTVVTLRNLTTAAMTDRVVEDIAHGANQTYYGQSAGGARWQIEHGSSGTPNTTQESTFKVSRYENFVDGSVTQGAEWSLYSAIMGINVGASTTTAQPVGVSGASFNSSTYTGNFGSRNPDACGLIGVGVVTGSGVGVAMGSHFEGHRQSEFAYCKGSEVQTRNLWGSANSADPAALADFSSVGISQACGLWVVTNDFAGGSGIDLGNPFGVKYNVGISFKSQNGGPASDVSIQDNGTASRSIYIVGTHATAALEIDHSAGKVIIGGSSGFTSRAAIRPAADTDSALLLMGATATQSAPLLRISTNAGVNVITADMAGLLTFNDVSLSRDATTRLKVSGSFNVADKVFLNSGGNIVVGGTGNAGYVELLEQTSAPSTPAAADRLKLYAEDAAGNDTVLKLVDNTGVVGRVGVVKGAGSPIWGMWGLNSSTTTSTDKTATINNLYIGAIQIGNPCSLTGIEYAVGTVVNGNVVATIYDANGVYVGATNSVAQAGASGAFQQLAFASALKLRAMGTYYIGLQFSSATARFWAINHTVFRTATGEITGRTYAEATSITPPATYTASIGPLIRTY